MSDRDDDRPMTLSRAKGYLSSDARTYGTRAATARTKATREKYRVAYDMCRVILDHIDRRDELPRPAPDDEADLKKQLVIARHLADRYERYAGAEEAEAKRLLREANAIWAVIQALEQSRIDRERLEAEVARLTLLLEANGLWQPMPEVPPSPPPQSWFEEPDIEEADPPPPTSMG